MLDLEILGKRYRLVSHARHLNNRLTLLMSGFRSDRREVPDLLVEVSNDRCVTGLGTTSSEFKSDDSLLAALESAILRDALRSSHIVALHSAVVGISGRIVLLLGASGSGKTTLTLGMLDRGCKFLSDEIAPVDPETGCVNPFPRCPAASRNTLALLNKHPADTPHTLVGNTYCLCPEQFDVAEPRSYPIDDVVFLARDDTAGLSHLSRSEGMTRLMQATAGVADRPIAFETSAQIAERARFHDLRNGGLQETLGLLQEAI